MEPTENISCWEIYEAIRKDDLQFIETIFNESIFKDLKSLLLTGEFVFTRGHIHGDSHLKQKSSPLSKQRLSEDKFGLKSRSLDVHFNRAVCIATAYRSLHVLKFLIDNDALLIDTYGGNNILHVLVWGYFIWPTHRDSYVNLYVTIRDQEWISKEQIAQFHHQSNDANLRPIELAGHLMTGELLTEFINTDEIFRHFLFEETPYSAYMYDVTDYEAYGSSSILNCNKVGNDENYNFQNTKFACCDNQEPREKSNSILAALLRVSENQLRSEEGTNQLKKILNSSLISKWVEIKAHRSRWFIGVKLIFQLLFLIAFLLMAAGLMKWTILSVEEITRGENQTDAEQRKLAQRQKKMRETFLYEVKGVSETGKQLRYREWIENGTCHLRRPMPVDYGYNNAEIDYVLQISMYYCLVFSLIVIIWNFIWLVMSIKTMYKTDRIIRRIHDGKSPVVTVRFYRTIGFVQALYVLLIFINNSSSTVKVAVISGGGIPIYIILYALMCIVNYWQLLYFLQLLPGIGYFITAFHRMIIEIGRYLLIYLLITMSFNHVLYFVNTLGCPPPKLTYLDTYYELFKISLNIYNIHHSDYLASVQYLFKIMHILLIFVVVFLLINFLIAVMADAIGYITESKSEIVKLYQLDAYLTVEQQIGWILAKVCPSLYYREFTIMNGRLYICAYIKSEAGSTQMMTRTDRRKNNYNYNRSDSSHKVNNDQKIMMM